MSNPFAIVDQFIDAWQRRDLEAIMGFFTDDAVYHNIPMPVLTGKEEIRGFIDGFLQSSEAIEFRVHHQAISDSGCIMNERTDYLTMGGNTIALPVMGIFELDASGTKIKGWRDYFDMAQFQDS